MLRIVIAINETPVNTLFIVNDGSGDAEIGNYKVYGQDRKAHLFRVEGHLREAGPTVLASRVLKDYLNLYGEESTRKDCLTCKYEPAWLGVTKGGDRRNASGICRLVKGDLQSEDFAIELLTHLMPYPGREYCNKWVDWNADI